MIFYPLEYVCIPANQIYLGDLPQDFSEENFFWGFVPKGTVGDYVMYIYCCFGYFSPLGTLVDLDNVSWILLLP